MKHLVLFSLLAALALLPACSSSPGLCNNGAKSGDFSVSGEEGLNALAGYTSITGNPTTADSTWIHGGFTSSCGFGNHLYCVSSAI